MALSTAWADEMLLGACPFKHRVHPKLELMTSQPEMEGAHRAPDGYGIWQEEEVMHGCGKRASQG